MYPAISLGSKDAHRLKINLGKFSYRFNTSKFLQEKYYNQLFNSILEFPVTESLILEERKPSDEIT